MYVVVSYGLIEDVSFDTWDLALAEARHRVSKGIKTEIFHDGYITLFNGGIEDANIL